MAEKRSQVSRRHFLKGSAFSVAAAALADRTVEQALGGLAKLGVQPPWFKRGQIKTTYNYCDMCPWRCGVVVSSVGGKVVKIEGNSADPKSRGMLCGRGQAGVSFMYDPDRLKTPLIRTGARGEGKFKTASWQEALDYSAERLLKIKASDGPEAVAFFGHTSGDFWFTDLLPQAWGSPNAAKPSMSMCTSPREEAALLTFGRSIGNHEPVDWELTDTIVLIGSHIGEDSRNTMMQDFANARGRGAKVIVVDPRFSTASMKADTWLPIKPGADTALMLAWMNVLITEGLVDRDYIDRYTVGYDKLVEHVKPLTPAWASAICDLPADQIRATARQFGQTRPRSVVVPGRHTVWYGNDTQRMRAVFMLNALVGGLGRPGGLYFNKPPFIDEHEHPPYAVTGGAGG